MMKRILITGGSRGIGAAFVRAFCGEGHEVVFTYLKATDRAEALVRELTEQGSVVNSIRADFADPTEVVRVAEEALQLLGGVDVLINNAAVLHYCDFLELDMGVWDETQAVNLRAPAELSRRLLRGMMERKWGRILIMSSIGGQWGGTLAVPYAVSKAGLIGLTRSLARIGAASGVTVNAIAPGLVDTDIIEGEKGSDAYRGKVDGIPLRRVAAPVEIAEAALYLASDSAGYITGQTINLNGGMYFG